MNANVIALIASFAKTNKIGKAKLEAFVSELVEMLPQTSGNKVGRKASPETVELRNSVMVALDELKDKAFTVKEVAEKLKAEPIHIHNALKFLKENNKISLDVVGKAEVESGKRGKKPVLYKIA